MVINLIRNTRTSTGLKVQARLDRNLYPTGIKVTESEFKTIAIERNSFHGEWNYLIRPQIFEPSQKVWGLAQKFRPMRQRHSL